MTSRATFANVSGYRAPQFLHTIATFYFTHRHLASTHAQESRQVQSKSVCKGLAFSQLFSCGGNASRFVAQNTFAAHLRL